MTEINLIPTDGYPYSFKYFNPVQSEAYPYRSEDTNIVISANTSSGKTVVAEICMDEVLKQSKRVVYLSPLRALTREKYDSWQKRFEGYNISILTGDYILSSSKKKELGNARIICMTSEMCDSYPYETKIFCYKNGDIWVDEIGNIVENNIQCDVFSYIKNIGFKPMPVTDRIKIGRRPVYKVLVKGQRSIRMTDCHNLFIMGKNKEPRSVRLKDISVGTYIALSSGFVTPSKKSEIPILDIILDFKKQDLERTYVYGPMVNKILSSEVEHIVDVCPLGCKTESEPIGTQRRVNMWRRRKCVPLGRVKDAINLGMIDKKGITKISLYHSDVKLDSILTVDNDLAFSIGVFLAEGYSGWDRTTISQKNKPEILIRCQKAFGGIIYDNGEKGKVLIFSRLWSRIFGNKRSLNKEIPKYVFSWEEDKIKSFISGFLVGDGTITDGVRGGGRNRFYSSSEKMIHGLQNLFLLLGKQSFIMPPYGSSVFTLYESHCKKSKKRNNYHKFLQYAKVLSIEPDGYEDVYDIEVKPSGNFIGGTGGLLLHNSRTRKMESEKNFWLKEVGLIVVDETHILSTSRGHAVEVGIMRFTSINKDARIIFLSATMPNVQELGDWLTSLNGKQTRVISSQWRPVELLIKIAEYNTQASYQEVQAEKRKKAIGLIKAKKSQKFLVFCHDKNTGRSLLKALEKDGIKSCFHNADLDLDERLEIEESFENREDDGLRILLSTSTLAWGRNLPARNVLIMGITRGIKEIDPIDIIQMAGRAGRIGYDDKGFVYLMVPEGEKEVWEYRIMNPSPVKSQLNNMGILGFHVLAEIGNGVIVDNESLLNWYRRSLAFCQQQYQVHENNDDDEDNRGEVF